MDSISASKWAAPSATGPWSTKRKWSAAGVCNYFLRLSAWLVVVVWLLLGSEALYNRFRDPHYITFSSRLKSTTHLFSSSDDTAQVDSSSSLYNEPVINVKRPQVGKSKIVVSSTWGKDANKPSWVSDLLPEWDHQSYITDDPELKGNLTLTKTSGREASVYLTYIIQHYYSLPEYVVFIHGPRYQSHNDHPMYDTYPLIANLSLDFVDEHGYVPLMCNWAPGCTGKKIHPIPGHQDDLWEISGTYAQVHKHFWPRKRVPKAIAAPCCAQFAVSRDTIHRNSISDYEKMRQYLWDTQGIGYEMKLGIVMEYMWHIIFGKPPVFCNQPAKQCYCQKWGVCNLECRKQECKGRVWPPPSHAIPEGWPENNGKGGWPINKWWEHLDQNWNFQNPNQTAAEVNQAQAQDYDPTSQESTSEEPAAEPPTTEVAEPATTEQSTAEAVAVESSSDNTTSSTPSDSASDKTAASTSESEVKQAESNDKDSSPDASLI